MVKLLYSALVIAFIFSVSCRTTTTGTAEERGNGSDAAERSEEAKEVIAKSRKLLQAGEIKAAQETLAPLLEKESPPKAALDLSARINDARAKEAVEEARKRVEDTAMEEVEERMELPESYGKTEIISPSTRKLPETLPGEMSKILAKKVSMRVQEAGVKDLIFTLSEIDEIEGLNIVADDALKAEKKLNISVEDVPLKDLLKYISRNMKLDFHIGDNIIWVTGTGEDKDWEPELKTKIYPLQTGFVPYLVEQEEIEGFEANMPSEKDRIADLEDALDSFLEDSPSGAKYRIYKNRNLLIARNSPENLMLIEKILDEVDRPPRQVLIEARFITISRQDLFSLGLNLQNILVPTSGEKAEFQDFRATSRTTTAKEDNKGNIKEIITEFEEETPDALKFKRLDAKGSGSYPGLPGELTISGILGNVTYEAVLEAIDRTKSSQTLSAPRVTVMNNHTAFIHQGRKRYYFEEYDLASVNEGDEGIRTEITPVGKPQELDSGFKLQVKASVGNDNKTVLLALQPSITEFEEWAQFSNNQIQLPNVTTNIVATTVGVESGETVVLGGTISNNISETETKIPYLGDIPLLGKLFSYNSTSEEPEHLLIFVTARVLGRSGRFQTTAADEASEG